jgi:hypothetical protein
VTSVNNNTWAVTVREFNPWTWNVGDVVTKTANWYEWATPTSWGDVSWPSSATNEHLAVFDWTTGKLIKDWWAIPTWVPTVWSDGQILTVVSWAPAWANVPAETVVSGDSWTTYTVKVANSDPASWTPATTITFVL